MLVPVFRDSVTCALRDMPLIPLISIAQNKSHAHSYLSVPLLVMITLCRPTFTVLCWYFSPPKLIPILRRSINEIRTIQFPPPRRNFDPFTVYEDTAWEIDAGSKLSQTNCETRSWGRRRRGDAGVGSRQ